MTSFFGELRRRNVVKVAVAYAIVGWLLVEVSSVLAPALRLPEWVPSLVALLLILGFPVAMLLTWAYELTPDGMTRTKSVPLPESITHITGRKLDFVIIGLMAVGITFLVVDNYVLDTAGPFAGADIDPASLDVVLDEPPSTAVELIPAVAEEQQREVLPNSVAVLPFANLSPDPDNAYYAAGIHEEILNQLVKIRGLNVIARTSVMQYADAPPPISQIAEELNVQTVMEGSVRYAGGQIRITTQLNDGITGAHIWSETYTRDFNDIFAIESDVAMNVANALEAEFSLAEQESIEKIPTESTEAYASYLRALVAPLDTAQLLLDQAIDADADFALAYAQKAFLHQFNLVGVGGAGPDEAAELERLVQVNAERALALDPTLGIAQAALAVPHYVNWRGAEAEQAFQRAIDLSPNDVDVLVLYGRFKRYRGEFDEATRLLQRVVELDPNSRSNLHQLAITYRQAGDWEAAAAAYTDILNPGPASAGQYIGSATAEAVRGNHAEAVRQLQIAERLEPNSFRLSQMAHVYALAGRPDEAMRLFADLEQVANENPVGDAVWIRAYMGVDDYEGALQRLESAIRNRSPTDLAALAGIAANPWNDPVLNEPEFRELLDGLWD